MMRIRNTDPDSIIVPTHIVQYMYGAVFTTVVRYTYVSAKKNISIVEVQV